MIYYEDLTDFGKFLVRHPWLIPVGVFLGILKDAWDSFESIFKEKWEDRDYAIQTLRDISEKYHS